MTTPTTPTVARPTLCDRATWAGYDDGWTHAAYVDAYGGDPYTEPDVPQRFAPVATYYTAAYGDGVTAYFADMYPDEPAPEADVMTARVATIADLGDYLDPDNDTRLDHLPAEHHGDPAHRADCSRRD